MNISIKNSTEIQKMRIVGQLAAEVLEMIEYYIEPNITTETLDNICHNYIIHEQCATSACLGYKGFPKSTCISINEVACHGIPNNYQKLKEGDIVNIDITIMKDQYYADTSAMFIVGKTNKDAQDLCYAAQQSLYSTFTVLKPGIKLNIIGKTIQKYINKTTFSIVEEYCGHGIGKHFHEDPHILHYDNNYIQLKLQEGMIFTIEPIINVGNKKVLCTKDGWTVKTKDDSLSAQYEHTILITKDGCEILTLRKTENIKQKYINI